MADLRRHRLCEALQRLLNGRPPAILVQIESLERLARRDVDRDGVAAASRGGWGGGWWMWAPRARRCRRRGRLVAPFRRQKVVRVTHT